MDEKPQPQPAKTAKPEPKMTKCAGCERAFKMGDLAFFPASETKVEELFCRGCVRKDKVQCRVLTYGAGRPSSVGRDRARKNNKRLARMAKRQKKAANRAASQKAAP